MIEGCALAPGSADRMLLGRLRTGGIRRKMNKAAGGTKTSSTPLPKQCAILSSFRPRNWPRDSIVATCNPDYDDYEHGPAVDHSVSGFAARTDEHSSDLLDHMIPHSVSDSRRWEASQRA
jgi:hypothetical protein